MSAENQSNKIVEMLKGLVGNYQGVSPNQSSKDISPLRKKSLMIFQKLEGISDKYVKQTWLKDIVMRFVRPHVTNVITSEIPEPELKEIMKEVYLLLKEDFEDFEISETLNENLNDEFKGEIRENGTRKNSITQLKDYSELAKLL